MHRFSVIVPTYNSADSIAQTLDSCFNQRYTDFEIIVVDDGSTDDTLAVLSAYNEPRLRVHSQANAGPAAARNAGMDKASGAYLAFLDSDDTWHPDFLRCAADLLAENSAQVLYGQIIVDRGVGRYWVKPDRMMRSNESIYDYLYSEGNFIQTSTLVMPASLKTEVRWDESVTFGDNDQFAIDLWRTGIPFTSLPAPLTLYADIMSPTALSQLPIYAGESAAHTNFFNWMATQKPFMSHKAWAGYQARFESVASARRAPLQTLAMLWRAKQAGAMSLKGLVRQTLQCFMPTIYRKLVDQYVRLRGVAISDIQR